MTEDRHALFSERYASGETPWDSGITPPEIVELLAELPAGSALDLGCGTGTVIRDLLHCMAGTPTAWTSCKRRLISRSAKLRQFASRQLTDFSATM